MHDLRFALRVFRKHPGYAALVVVTLALGLGAVTTLVSVADATFLGRLPVPDGDRVVSLYDRQPGYDPPATASWPEVKDWREHARSLDGVAGEYTFGASWVGKGEPERVNTSLVTQDYLRVFGLKPIVGRGFSPDEHKKGAPPVALLGSGFWIRAFAGDPRIIGQAIMLDGMSYTAVGVLAPETLEQTRGKRDVLVPAEPRLPSEGRGEHYMPVFGHLAAGATLASARAELDALGPTLDVDKAGHRIGIMSLRELLYGSARGGFLILLGAAGFLLVIACANVTSIMLARVQSRSQELGVRAALGASQGHLIRHFLTESLLLSLTGGALGVLLALWGKDFLLALWPARTPQPASVPLSWATVIAATAVAIIVGVVVGVVPAWRGSRAGLAHTLHAGAVPRSGRLRSSLVVIQHAVAILVLVGAALLGKSLMRLVAVNPGFDATNLVTLEVTTPDSRYPDSARRRIFYEAVTGRLRSQAGVLGASVVSTVPFGNSETTSSFEIAGRPEFPSNAKPQARDVVVDGEYFRTMRIPILEGRSFGRAEHRLEMVINKTFADRYFKGASALGQHIDPGGGPAEVVGVVADVHHQGLADEPELQLYRNLENASGRSTFVVRVNGDPARFFATLKAQVYGEDPNLAVSSIGTMDDRVARSAAARRVVAIMVAGFAAIALILAALGIYGVLAYSVSQRTREIGVRMALGARSTSVLALVLRQGIQLALAGTVLGLLGAIVLARFFDAFLFEVSATDPLIYAGVALVLLTVGLVACFIPARRAAGVDPMAALKAD